VGGPIACVAADADGINPSSDEEGKGGIEEAPVVVDDAFSGKRELHFTEATASSRKLKKGKNRKSAKQPSIDSVDEIDTVDEEEEEEDCPADFLIFSIQRSEDEDKRIFNEAKDEINKFVDSLSLNFDTTSDALNTLSVIANAASMFIPAMAIFGGIFGQFADLTDPFQEEVTASLKEIHGRLTRIEDKIEGLMGQFTAAVCFNTFDSDFLRDTRTLRSIYDNFNAATGPLAKTREYNKLKEECANTGTTPAFAFTTLEDFVLDRDILTSCHHAIADSTTNRIRVYQRQFVLPMTRYILKVMELEGICEGTQGTIRPRTIENMTNRIEEMQRNMATKQEPMYTRWQASFQKAHDGTVITTAAVLNILQTDYCPGDRYGVFQINQDKVVIGGDSFHSYGDQHVERQGDLQLKVKDLDSWLVVMWIAPDIQPGGNLAWRNLHPLCGSGGTQPMCRQSYQESYCCRYFIWCTRRCTREACQLAQCGTATSGLDNNNRQLGTDLALRNAYSVTTSSLETKCLTTIFGVQLCQQTIQYFHSVTTPIYSDNTISIQRLDIQEGEDDTTKTSALYFRTLMILTNN